MHSDFLTQSAMLQWSKKTNILETAQGPATCHF